MTVARSIALLALAYSAAIHLYFGLVFIFSPEQMMADLSIAATSTDGMTEMRTFYGGLMFAMGCFFALGMLDRSLTRAALIMMTLTYFAAVVVRSYGFSLATPQTDLLWNILYVEASGLVLGIVALWFLRREN